MEEIYIDLFVDVLCHCPVLGHAVALLVERMRYEPQGCGFDWDFSLNLILSAVT
jgi:hypothetical protein